MTKDIFHIAHIGWTDYRDENLLKAILMMSKNIEEATYRASGEAVAIHATSPLQFDCFNHPVIFYHHLDVFSAEEIRKGLDNYIADNMLSKSDGILFSLGGPLGDIPGLKKERGENLWHVKRFVKMVRISKLPTIYTLSYWMSETDLASVKKILGISNTDTVMTYNYHKPGTLKQILCKLLNLSKQQSS